MNKIINNFRKITISLMLLCFLILLLLILILIDGKNLLSSVSHSFSIYNINIEYYITIVTVALTTLGSFLVSNYTTNKQNNNALQQQEQQWNNQILLQENQWKREQELKFEDNKLESELSILKLELLMNQNRKEEFLTTRKQIESSHLYKDLINGINIFDDLSKPGLLVLDDNNFVQSETGYLLYLLNRINFQMGNHTGLKELFRVGMRINPESLVQILEIDSDKIFVFNEYYSEYITSEIIKLNKVNQEKLYLLQKEIADVFDIVKRLSIRSNVAFKTDNIKLNKALGTISELLRYFESVGLRHKWNEKAIQQVSMYAKEISNNYCFVYDNRYPIYSQLLTYDSPSVIKILNDLALYDVKLNGEALKIQSKIEKTKFQRLNKKDETD